ncbi:unnamed protein product, partial [Symbiodinium natans]
MGAAPFVEVVQRHWDFRPSLASARRAGECCHPFLEQFLGLGALLETAGALTAASWAALVVVVYRLEGQQHSDANAY